MTGDKRVPCPFCEEMHCDACGAYGRWVRVDESPEEAWDSRPIEDRLRAENERLTYEHSVALEVVDVLHDEITDLEADLTAEREERIRLFDKNQELIQLCHIANEMQKRAEIELSQERERNRWSIKDKKFTGYKGAFNGLRAHHNSMMKLAINYLTHVTGSGDNSVEHYWKSDCTTCKEIASFIASWRPIVPPEVE